MTDTLTTVPTLDQRLAGLPPKVSGPFRQLLSIGHLPEDVIHTVLDAGDITGDSTKLIGFAAGFLHLRGQGIPVHDVIRMAKQQNSRINLAWSAARWKDEHERLSRAEALRRLADQNVHYDLAAYDKHLPAHFPGYLIRSSRRLGMEGLRQRHCVASYHDRLMKGVCAIAAVFVEKQRWTVQLEFTPEPDRRLLITQIKTRYNALPPAAVRSRIHELLGIALPRPAESRPAGTDENCLYFENLRRVLPVLRQHGIETVTASFDGSGDSGSIHDISYEPRTHAHAASTANVEHLRTQRFFDDGQWKRAVTAELTTVNAAIDSLTYDYLEEVGVDWYNDDGGFGELIIDVEQGSVSLEVNHRYTESTTEYSGEFDIETGDER
ncbi:MAG: DUF6878 family protein [Hyphomicrobium sp.]|jgi:hypothetical protein